MYRTCLYCQQDLGRNEALEAFPVGRRLAYDAAQGRLWVVCGACARWNLTPLEERWEAVEQAERLFRGTRLRVSTDHVGLARVADGTELVRVGRPLRPELAAWRYGDRFGRRRRRNLAVAGVAGAAVAGAVAGGLWSGAIGVPFLLVWGEDWYRTVRYGPDFTRVARLRLANGEALTVRRGALRRTTVTNAADGDLVLRVPVTATDFVTLRGAAARAAAGALFAAANRLAGAPQDVAHAARFLDEAGSAERLLGGVRRFADQVDRTRRRLAAFGHGDPTLYEQGLFALTPAQRLAVEMALHEEQERRALEGELAALERAWRDAEALAAVADSLALPLRVERAYEALRARTRER